MKKIIYFLILLILLPVNISASVKTYERSREELRVNKDIEITEKNINAVLSTPSVDASQKVYDFSNILLKSEVIKSQIFDTSNKYNIDIAVITVNDINKSSLKDYAQDFFDFNDFGIDTNNYDGLCLIIDMVNREYGVYTYGEAILYIDDKRIEEILDVMESYMKAGQYDQAMISSINKIDYLYNEGIPSSNKDNYIDENGVYRKKEKIPVAAFALISFIITLVIMIILVNTNKMVRKATIATEYIDQNAININNRQDKFIRTHTTSSPKPSSSNSGGGFSGGSSTSIGSSGRSSGGGSRGF